ncbi:MAG: LEA type 2 family protein [Candidatus Nanohalobium sp.]
MLRLAALAGTLAVVLAASTGIAATGFQKPSFGVVEKGEWANTSGEKALIKSEVWINNPNPVSIPAIIDLSYSVESENITLASGEIKDLGLEKGNNTVELKTKLNAEKIPAWWEKHVRQGEESQLSVKVSFHIPFQSFERNIFNQEIETDFSKTVEEGFEPVEGSYTGPEFQIGPKIIDQSVRPEMEVKDVEVEFGNVSNSTTELFISFEASNPNEFSIPAPRFTGSVDVDGLKMVEWNSTPVNGVEEIPGGSSRTLKYSAAMNHGKLDEMALNHVQSGGESSVGLQAAMVFEFRGERFRLPEEGFDCEMTLSASMLEGGEKPGMRAESCKGLN